MNTYLITFANVFEAALFKEFMDNNAPSYPFHNIEFISSRFCRISSPKETFIYHAYVNDALSANSKILRKRIIKNKVKYMHIELKPSKYVSHL